MAIKLTSHVKHASADRVHLSVTIYSIKPNIRVKLWCSRPRLVTVSVRSKLSLINKIFPLNWILKTLPSGNFSIRFGDVSLFASIAAFVFLLLTFDRKSSRCMQDKLVHNINCETSIHTLVTKINRETLDTDVDKNKKWRNVSVYSCYQKRTYTLLWFIWPIVWMSKSLRYRLLYRVLNYLSFRFPVLSC